MLRHLYDRLIASHVAGRVVALFIDEAQNLDVQTLEGLRMLSNLETRKQKLLQIILIGQPELETKLQRNDLRQLSQRIAVHAVIKPLTRKESIAYIRHRISVAADKPGEVFTPAALRLIARKSKGIPRRLNILSDRTLMEGYAAQKRPAGTSMVRAALAQSGDPLQRPLFRRVTLTLGALALIALMVAGFPYLASRPTRPQENPVVEAAVLPEEVPPQSAAMRPLSPAKDITTRHSREQAFTGGKPDASTSQPAGTTSEDEASREVLRLRDTLGDAGAVLPRRVQERGPVMTPPAPLLPKHETWAVHPGDTLTDIIRTAHGEVTDAAIAAVRALNPQIRNANLIFPGDLITLPPKPAGGPGNTYAPFPWNSEEGS
jgi:general secretion pathway protein A